MQSRWRFPIRFKLLITALFLITAVVSAITFAMARLFHDDKTAYIHDLTSTLALHAAQETRSLLASYGERLQVFARVMQERGMPKEQKTRLLRNLFEDFEDFVAITHSVNGREQATVYDRNTLKAARLTMHQLASHRNGHPLPYADIQAGSAFVENSTIVESLPTLTLAVPYQTAPRLKSNAVIAAVVRLERLLDLAGRSAVFEMVIADSRGNVLAHRDLRNVVDRTPIDWIPELDDLRDGQSLGRTLEYTHNGIRMVGGFSPVQVGGLLVGVQIPKTAAYLTARKLLNDLIVVALALLAVSALISLFWSRLITRPMIRLSRATKDVARGQFDIRVEANTRDEIEDLARSFNTMTAELHAREQALQESQEALIHSEKMAAFGQFGAGIAHEVKNPLAGILGFAQLSLRKIGEDDPIRENLLMIEKEAKRSKTIIENLLKFARQEKAAFSRIDVNGIVEEALAIMEHQLAIHHVKLRHELTPDLPHIIGNTNQLQQVMMNMLINAQQAAEGKPGTVTVSTGVHDHDRIEIRVQDDGPGIPKEMHAKLFEPFFTTKRTGKGTGLGLSVSYGIIKSHRGEITIENALGSGAVFVITLPAATSPGAPAISENQGEAQQ